MYSSMFSGRHILRQDLKFFDEMTHLLKSQFLIQKSKDKNGRFFVDRDPTLFSHILSFLRNDTLPPSHLAFSIYNEAKYLSLQELYSKLGKLLPIYPNGLGQTRPSSLTVALFFGNFFSQRGQFRPYLYSWSYYQKTVRKDSPSNFKASRLVQ